MANNDDVSHRLRGAIDGDVLFTIRDEFLRQAPLATATVDDMVSPSVLMVELTAGLQDESTGRFETQWTIEGDYKFHYTEDDLDFRWGHHPHGGDYNVQGDAHFHPPPNASSHPNDIEPSCFTVHRPKLVTRGVLKNWHAAYHDGPDELNSPEYTG
ncbi:hypothetical protein EA462_01475 [Natrarchaeobius halalkaliphilus]|uniref:Uncharacterized protein n=1 Tax=Natrarchaeobius halalkaliphilus TaxID=1679091 RepID=A0A3N6P4M6_9EURY|nr:hypothetical protein [Natrarchaeobius halalkaliphilus]RQG92919.1 hypothetical protein EA462_01475 [Natrarchaeobius halalkaliphilus]